MKCKSIICNRCESTQLHDITYNIWCENKRRHRTYSYIINACTRECLLLLIGDTIESQCIKWVASKSGNSDDDWIFEYKSYFNAERFYYLSTVLIKDVTNIVVEYL